ncbi:MAG: bifunctional enoyl-CoA hydratase/phosphate acetyltransferase [Kiloniellales bacterium]
MHLPESTTADWSAAETAHPRMAALIASLADQPPVPTAVVQPTDHNALLGALAAAHDKTIEPILVGQAEAIGAAAKEAGVSLEGLEIVPAENGLAAARAAVALVREGRAKALMKGNLHTDELLIAALDKAAGIRTSRRLSHCFLMDVPSYPKLLAVTDAAVNIAPELEVKAAIVQSAIDLVRALGVVQPKVALLAAVETVNPKMPATLDAAALCKMADRGQITGGILDGPLAFDNAISAEAAATKHIRSEVAGDPDILLVPEITAGNILVKELTFLAGAAPAGVVLGAGAPIMLTSRADPIMGRRGSAAAAAALALKG